MRCLGGEDSDSPTDLTASATQPFITTNSSSSVSATEHIAEAMVGDSSATGDTGLKKSTMGQATTYDFIVAAQAELEAHSARHLAQLPLVGLRRREGYYRLRLIELCRGLLWTSPKDNEASTPSEVDIGPKEEKENKEALITESQTEVCLDSTQEMLAEVKVSMATSQLEQPDSDSAAMLSHETAPSPSSSPCQSALGAQVGGGAVCHPCVPLVGLEGSPSQTVYALSFRAVDVTKLAWHTATNHLSQLYRSLVGVKSHRLCTGLVYSHQFHLLAQLQQCDPDCTGPFLSRAVALLLSPLHEQYCLPGAVVVTESRLLLGFFKAVSKFNRASDKVLDHITHNPHGGSEGSKNGLSRTPDAPSTQVESQVGVCPGGPVGSQGSTGCVNHAVGDSSDLEDSGLAGWELLAEETCHRVYRKPYQNTGLFQYKGE